MIEHLELYSGLADATQWALDNKQMIAGIAGGAAGTALKAWRCLTLPFRASKAVWKWATDVPPLSDACQALLSALDGDCRLTAGHDVQAGSVLFDWRGEVLTEAKVAGSNALVLLEGREKRLVNQAANAVRKNLLALSAKADREAALRNLLNATTQPGAQPATKPPFTGVPHVS